MPQHPQYIVFAGVNGVGKSTLYKSGFWKNGTEPKTLQRVNPDEILQELGGNSASEADQLRAGKESVRRIQHYLKSGKSFTQETTLSGKAALKTIQQAKGLGYDVTIHYVGVESVSLAQERIAHRVLAGGHNISPELVQRRYNASLQNLSKAIDYCNEIHIYDNTFAFKEVAAWSRGVLCWWGCSSVAGDWFSHAMQDDAVWQR